MSPGGRRWRSGVEECCGKNVAMSVTDLVVLDLVNMSDHLSDAHNSNHEFLTFCPGGDLLLCRIDHIEGKIIRNRRTQVRITKPTGDPSESNTAEGKAVL
jgi:hypothetical protein